MKQSKGLYGDLKPEHKETSKRTTKVTKIVLLYEIAALLPSVSRLAPVSSDKIIFLIISLINHENKTKVIS